MTANPTTFSTFSHRSPDGWTVLVNVFAHGADTETTIKATKPTWQSAKSACRAAVFAAYPDHKPAIARAFADIWRCS